MRPRFDAWDIDGEVVFDRYLGADADLDVLQSWLAALAPRWSSKLRVWRGPKDERPIDIGRPGALRTTVMAAVQERGPTYRALVERYGQPSHERTMGSAELRGAGPEFVAVVSVDETVVSHLGVKQQLGNRVVLQVRRPEVEGRPGEDWVQEAFEALCADLSPAWGHACHPDEYWAKVMTEPPGADAIGRDFGRFLPGLFWLNFFGRPYRELVGHERLTSTPVQRVASVDSGVLIAIEGDPSQWQAPEYQRSQQIVVEHLGPDLFFSKAEPHRHTVAPNWGPPRS